MAVSRRSTIIRILKPIVAGVALAYLVTAFVDKPASVHFQPENPYASKQEEIVESQSAMVVEKNIMKLGSPLSMTPEEGVPTDNPLAPLATMIDGNINATFADGVDADNATQIIRKGVETLVAQ